MSSEMNSVSVGNSWVILYIKSDVMVGWKLWNYTISGYQSNELSTVSTLREPKLRSRWQVNSLLFQYRVYFVSIDNLFYSNMCNMQFAIDYLWEIALYVSLSSMIIFLMISYRPDFETTFRKQDSVSLLGLKTLFCSAKPIEVLPISGPSVSQSSDRDWKGVRERTEEVISLHKN
jgi:hypothetical protein